ncbi:DUF4179 domain-containing protein [Paenibacillus contaminans]|uniref:DUF4179 domain-containing protein n=1 Tax=Paenibacillus contaminans TaxID=450362 RepID=A0A329MCV6_9BACL|nr:DUF4179 domain-containing protein [Paenibacillus contaminans]RAV14877.1 hypothetical protein DQG23_31085 [Paenibacillus contaminans]
MSDKHINQLFEAFTPKNKQKEKIFRKILEKNKNETTGLKKFTPLKRLRPAVLAAVLMVCLTTTAVAAAFLELDEVFLKFLKPVSYEQAQYLSNGAYVVDKQVVNESGSLTIKQVIGDSNLIYILMDFTAPEGTVLNAARYRFMDPNISTEDHGVRSTGFKVLDDGNPNDNKISLVMNIMTENSVAGQTAHFKFKDLQAADPLPGIFQTVIPGSWETTFKLDFKEYSKIYNVNQSIAMFDYKAVIKSISVSPISITLKIESSSSKEISEASEAASKLKQTSENEYLDRYPITIKYKDGTSETTSTFNGMSVADRIANQILTIKTFENVINDKEIASIVFLGAEIPIEN